MEQHCSLSASRGVLLQALAVMEEKRGDREAAMALLERALQQDPLHVPSWQVGPSRMQ